METKTQNPTATLRALRTCKTCKGLCHEGSYRTKNDEHKTYFCCEAHNGKNEWKFEYQNKQ